VVASVPGNILEPLVDAGAKVITVANGPVTFPLMVSKYCPAVATVIIPVPTVPVMPDVEDDVNDARVMVDGNVDKDSALPIPTADVNAPEGPVGPGNP
jgi:hypothetical protein